MLSDRLNEIISTHGLSARQFALRLDRNPATVHEYVKKKVEEGRERRTPPADLIADVCREFDVSPLWLLLGEGPVEQSKAATAVDRKLLEGALLAVDEGGGGDLSPDIRAKIILEVYTRAIETGAVDAAGAGRLVDMHR